MDVAIIDYKMSNLFSVQAACENVGLSSIITSEKDLNDQNKEYKYGSLYIEAIK